jgi:hypothetical protein
MPPYLSEFFSFLKAVSERDNLLIVRQSPIDRNGIDVPAAKVENI